MPQSNYEVSFSRTEHVRETTCASTFAEVERELLENYGGDIEIHSIIKEEED